MEALLVPSAQKLIGHQHLRFAPSLTRSFPPPPRILAVSSYAMAPAAPKTIAHTFSDLKSAGKVNLRESVRERGRERESFLSFLRSKGFSCIEHSILIILVKQRASNTHWAHYRGAEILINSSREIICVADTAIVGPSEDCHIFAILGDHHPGAKTLW